MPTDVKAAVCRTVGEPLEIETVELDDPAPDEVRVGVVGSGLCHSDLHVIDGSFPAPLPVILGHEVAGVVLEVGSQIQGIEVGDHVGLVSPRTATVVDVAQRERLGSVSRGFLPAYDPRPNPRSDRVIPRSVGSAG